MRSAENLRMPETRGADWRFLTGGPFDWLFDTNSIGANRLDEAAREREPDRPALTVLEAPDPDDRLDEAA